MALQGRQLGQLLCARLVAEEACSGLGGRAGKPLVPNHRRLLFPNTFPSISSLPASLRPPNSLHLPARPLGSSLFRVIPPDLARLFSCLVTQDPLPTLLSTSSQACLFAANLLPANFLHVFLGCLI